MLYIVKYDSAGKVLTLHRASSSEYIKNMRPKEKLGVISSLPKEALGINFIELRKRLRIKSTNRNGTVEVELIKER
jgi:hypothetical protein